MEKYKVIIGIDPGSTGAITLMFPAPAYSIDIFEFSKLSYKNIYHTLLALKTSFDFIVWIEDVHSFSGDHVNTAFAFGRNLGKIENVMDILELPLNKVDPQVWQRHFSLGGRHAGYDATPYQLRKSKKDAIWNKAKAMFPDTKILKSAADSVLIAKYGFNMQLDI